MGSAEAVAAVVEAGGAHVPGLLERLEARLHGLAGSHGEVLGRHAEATMAAGGKRLRPLLIFLLAARDDEPVLRAGAAVELVHAATLVHDDVLDDAPLRRGRPTVVAAAGREVAVAVGDLLFSRAFAELAANGSAAQVRVLSDAASALADGELLQRAEAWDLTVDRARYERRCDLKTARLFEAAARLGGLLREPAEPAPALAALGAFGRRIGLAFQLLDDVLDVAGPAERTGKQRGADLLDGTITLPFVLARARDPELAALDLRAEVRDAASAAAVADRVAASGALEAVRAEALAMVEAAKAALPPLPAAERAALELVADGVVERYR